MKKRIIVQMTKMALRELLETAVVLVVMAVCLGVPILCAWGALRLIAIAWGERTASLVFLFAFLAGLIAIGIGGIIDLYKKAKLKCNGEQLDEKEIPSRLTEEELVIIPTFRNCKFVVEKRGTTRFCVLAENVDGTSQPICVIETNCSYMNHALAITISEALSLYYSRLTQ